MSMSTNVIGIKPADEKWKKMKAIWDSCQKGKIAPPEEVFAYFEYKDPDPKGIKVEIENQKYEDEGSSGVEVDISKLSKDIKIIRFYNSW